MTDLLGQLVKQHIKTISIIAGGITLLILLFNIRKVWNWFKKTSKWIKDSIHKKKQLSRLSSEDLMHQRLYDHQKKMMRQKEKENRDKIAKIKKHEKNLIRDTIKKS